MLHVLLREDFEQWESLIAGYEQQALSLKVPRENSTTTLSEFNSRLDELFTKASFDFNRARVNKDVMNRFIKTVSDDYYEGANDKIRKAAALRMIQNYPTPEFYIAQYGVMNINLFELQYRFDKYYYTMEAVMKSLDAKASSRITTNSLLKLESATIN